MDPLPLQPSSEDTLQVLKEQLKVLNDIKVSCEENRNLLQDINSNTKTPDDEVWHKTRQDLGGEKVTLHVRVNIIAIGDINNVSQEFTAELYIICKYREPLLKGKMREEVDWQEAWDPRIVLGNSVSIDKIVKKHRLEYDGESDIPIASISLRVKGVFKEKMELERFPFDYQELTILIESNWPQDDVEFVKDMGIKDSIRLDTFTGVQEFELCQHVIAGPIVSEREAASSHRIYPRYLVKTNVVRRPAYYLWNVALIMALIMLLTFASLAVPSTEVADRLSVTLTLLLTSVAFKFVVSQSLPTISYLTLLDTYVIICMVVQVLMAAQNAIASLFVGATNAKLFDIVCAGVLGSFVFLVHVVMGVVIGVWINKRNRYLHTATKEYFALNEKINEAWLAKKNDNVHIAVKDASVDETSKRRRKHKKVGVHTSESYQKFALIDSEHVGQVNHAMTGDGE